MKLVPSASMRCSTTASLRASATLALRIPARLARRIPQLFRVEPFTGRVRMTLAAFVECGTHAAVPDLGNATGYIGLARLILLGRQSEMRPDGLGGSEPARI